MALDNMVTKIEPSTTGTIPADPTLETYPADDCGGDALQHEAAAEIGLARTGARSQHERAKSRQQTASDIGEK